MWLNTQYYGKMNATFAEVVCVQPVSWFRVTDNIVLGDKTLAKESAEANVGAIVAIMPTSDDYSKAPVALAYTHIPNRVITYNKTGKSLLDLNEFEAVGGWIKSVLDPQKTLMIVCNSGFQRSIPFLAWYLIHYCKMPEITISKLVDMTMPYYDLDGYKHETLRKMNIDNITILLHEPGPQ